MQDCILTVPWFFPISQRLLSYLDLPTTIRFNYLEFEENMVIWLGIALCLVPSMKSSFQLRYSSVWQTYGKVAASA